MPWSKVIKSLEIDNHEVNNFSLGTMRVGKIQEFVPMKKKEEIREPQEEYSRLIREAEIEARKIKEEAYRKGFSEGKEEGLRMAQERAERLFKEIRTYMDRLEDLEEDLCRESEREVVELALAIARKIIIREITTDPLTIAHIARAALEKIPFSLQIKIRVNPADWEYITKKPFDTGKYKDIAFEPDNTINPGGCYIETEFGDIDARWEEQLQEIERLFKGLIPKPGKADKKGRRTKKTSTVTHV